MSPQVVVTGIGMVTPFATGREASWSAILRGERAGRALEMPLSGTSAKPVGLRCFGAPVDWRTDAEVDGSNKGANAADEPIVRLALVAADEAWGDASLETAGVEGHRLGCVIGTSKGGLRSFARLVDLERNAVAPKPRASAPDASLWRMFQSDAPSTAVANRFQARGASLCPVAACATGLVSILRGVDLIREGACDVVLAGSVDASLVPVVVSSFQRLGVLARGADAAAACRPFDKNRSGFLIGEGGAVLVLERRDHAAARGARVYGTCLGGAMLADAAGLTHLDPSGAGLERLIHDALRSAGLSTADIDYVNMHGTGTRENDRCETLGIKRAFGPSAPRLAASSLKGAMGHLLGAAGSVEAACALLALRDGVVPPTMNLTDPDPECDLDYTPNISRVANLRTTLKLSLGFGGHLAAAVLARD